MSFEATDLNMSDETPLDSSAKIAEFRKDFETDGIVQPDSLQFMFDYIGALEIALECSAGAGLTQAESDALDESDEVDYRMAGYVEDALAEKYSSK